MSQRAKIEISHLEPQVEKRPGRQRERQIQILTASGLRIFSSWKSAEKARAHQIELHLKFNQVKFQSNDATQRQVNNEK